MLLKDLLLCHYYVIMQRLYQSISHQRFFQRQDVSICKSSSLVRWMWYTTIYQRVNVVWREWPSTYLAWQGARCSKGHEMWGVNGLIVACNEGGLHVLWYALIKYPPSLFVLGRINSCTITPQSLQTVHVFLQFPSPNVDKSIFTLPLPVQRTPLPLLSEWPPGM